MKLRHVETMLHNGSQAREVADASSPDTHGFRSDASWKADYPPLTANTITPVQKDLRPESYDYKTRAENTQLGLMKGKKAGADETHTCIGQLFGQGSTHRLKRTSIEEDRTTPSPPRWSEPTETTTLLEQGDVSRRAALFKNSGDHVSGGQFETSRKHELLLLLRNASPLMVTCLLQYTLTGASVLAVGHLGRNELGAVSLASMTANITGYVIYEGLSTGLDTLCAEAYGSAKLHLVGLHMQRMIFFLWLVTVPIAVVWLNATQILLRVIPEKECARLAGLYLRILLLGAPGFAAFEAGKRFVQAQGLFAANLYVLLFCAPLNGILNWLFVWVCRSGPRGRSNTNLWQTALQLGLHRCTNSSRHDAQPPRFLPLSIRLLCRRRTMLARCQQASPQELESHGQTRLLGLPDGNRRVFGL